MAAYCTQSELETRFGSAMLLAATDRGEEPAEAIDAAAVTRAITDADALIDGYLAARYVLPLASVPTLINTLSLTIAIYRLHPSVTDEKIRKDYEDAVKTLQLISRGDIRLDVAGTEPEAASHDDVRTNEPERPLSAGTMKGYI
jgi:phage gp36-like protein